MLLSLLVLGGAIASLRITRRIHDDILKIVVGLMGLVCLIASLVIAPWVLKLMMVVGLLTLPNCWQRQANAMVICPQLCIAKGRCRTPVSNCLGWVRSPLHHKPKAHPTSDNC